MDHLVLEIGLALGLIGAAMVIANRFGLSTVPFLIVIGMVVGPHAPTIWKFDFRFVETEALISFMGRMGVLFLLFYLGLESNVSRLVKAGRSILVGGSTYISINFLAGLTFAFLAGFNFQETLVVAGITTISSSAIVAKILFDYRRTANPETELILGITMFEDVFLAVYLSLLSGIVLSSATSVAGVAASGGVALIFIIGLIVAGRWATPLLDRLFSIASSEVFIVVVFAALFLLAGLGETIHVAESIGALLLGLILGETTHSQRMENLVVPFRDFFGALFFFSFGLSIDPFSLSGAAGMAAGAAAISLAGVTTAALIVGRRMEMSLTASLNIGFTLLARGEFSIIIAGLAVTGSLDPSIQPFAALYVLILASVAPLLAKESGRIADLVEGLRRSLAELRRGPEGNDEMEALMGDEPEAGRPE